MYLRLASYGPSDSMVMVDRIVDGQHWTAWNSDTTCKVAFSHPAERRAWQERPAARACTGPTRCRADDGNGLDVPGQKPFDLKATFSAS